MKTKQEINKNTISKKGTGFAPSYTHYYKTKDYEFNCGYIDQLIVVKYYDKQGYPIELPLYPDYTLNPSEHSITKKMFVNSVYKFFKHLVRFIK